MSLKIDSSNETPLLPQNQDEQIIKKDAAIQIGISSYELKDVNDNWGEEIWRPDGVKKFLHPILGDRWGRVQTASASDDDFCKETKEWEIPGGIFKSKTEKPCDPPHDKDPPPPHDKDPKPPHDKDPPPPHDKDPYCKEPSCI